MRDGSLAEDYSSPSLLTAFVMMQMSCSSALSLALCEEDDVKWVGQSQSPNTPLRPKLPEKGRHLFRRHSPPNRDHVAHSGGTLFMLSEEDEWMLSLSRGDGEARGHWANVSSLVTGCSNPLPAVFSHRSLGERKREGTRGGVALWKRKLTASAERQDWKRSQLRAISGIYPSVTHTQRECHRRAGYSRTSYNDGAAFATTLRWNLLF